MNRFHLLCLWGLFFLPRSAMAELFVDVEHASCDDARSRAANTRDTPWCSIQAAADKAQAGDIVQVEPGVYADLDQDGIVVSVSSSGSTGNPVTFRSGVPWGAIVEGVNPPDPLDHTYCWSIFSGRHDIVIEGFEVRGCSTGFNINNSNFNIVVRKNWIHDIGRRATNTSSGQSAVSFGGGSHDVVIDANLIHTVGRFPGGDYPHNHDHGVYIRSTDISITNNVFFDMQSGWCIHIYQPNLMKERIQILNNTFAEPNPGRAGHIIICELSRDVVIENNIFYQPNTAAIQVYSCTQVENITLRNNLLTTSELTSTTPCAGYAISENRLSTDPQFVDASLHDFHLTPESPAVDTGSTLSLVPFDFDGVTRPLGRGYDLGAFELIPSVAEEQEPAPDGGSLTDIQPPIDSGSSMDVEPLTDAGTADSGIETSQDTELVPGDASDALTDLDQDASGQLETLEGSVVGATGCACSTNAPQSESPGCGYLLLALIALYFKGKNQKRREN